MKRNVCELCNGEQFLKTDGFFVCESCGMKYTAEEMRKMLENRCEDEGEPVVKKTPAAVINTAAVKKTPEKHSSTNKATTHGKNMAKKNGANSSDDEKKDKSKKKKIIKIIIPSVVFAILLAVFIVCAIAKAGALLIISGLFELGIATILYKIMIHIERYNCPACAAKRVHHRRYIRTTEQDKTYKFNDGTTYKTIYKHYYRDTYECPECGETRVENITKDGGYYLERANGSVDDHRRDPKEF